MDTRSFRSDSSDGPESFCCLPRCVELFFRSRNFKAIYIDDYTTQTRKYLLEVREVKTGSSFFEKRWVRGNYICGEGGGTQGVHINLKHCFKLSLLQAQ